MSVPDPGGNTYELQADCLAGVYTQDAEEQRLLDPGDITEAVTVSRDSGDPLGLPQDSPGSHGINDDRIKAFMRGYLNGLEACNLPLDTVQTLLEETVDQTDPVLPTTDTISVPSTLPLGHAACFRVEDDGVLTFDELAARLGGTDDARTRLRGWGWVTSSYGIFACDDPPDGEAGLIDVGLHLFANADSARQAVDYFAAVRAEGTTLMTATPPAIGDHAAVLSGPATNGKEFTLYASRGPLLVRVTGVSPSGIPFTNVLTVAQSLLDMPLPEPPQTSSTQTQGVAAYLPDSLPLGHAACFRVEDSGTLDFPALVERFPDVPDAASRLQAFGWQASAYRQFGCDAPAAGRAGWIDMSVHQFQDAASAAAAVPFFADSRANGTDLEAAAAPTIGDSATALAGPASNGREHTLYMSTGPLLFRVTGVAPDGDPAQDVEQVMIGLLAGSVIVGQREEPSAAVPAPPTATVIPTLIIIPTATAIPLATTTATPMPTTIATLTPTPVPVPTATAPPATTTPQPTATPRVVQTPVSAEPTPRPSVTTAPSSKDCQLVELYPGYPGYSGYVAGVDGPGEVACLDDLIATDPSFEKIAEDAANRAAARAIELAGLPADWTWENWMAIEAERGLPLTCYSCLFRDDDPQPVLPRAASEPSDPRLLMGGYGTTDAISQSAALADMGPMATNFIREQFRADHMLRAFVGLTWPGHHTAEEMIGAYDTLFEGIAGPGNALIGFEAQQMWETILIQGGYAPTPSTAHIDDQLYMVRTSVEAICVSLADCDAWLDFYNSIEVQFLNDASTTDRKISYAQWLKEQIGNPLSS